MFFTKTSTALMALAPAVPAQSSDRLKRTSVPLVARNDNTVKLHGYPYTEDCTGDTWEWHEDIPWDGKCFTYNNGQDMYSAKSEPENTGSPPFIYVYEDTNCSEGERVLKVDNFGDCGNGGSDKSFKSFYISW
ncbi:hypothetical protein BJX70DRAFT_377724 [Aspergillus crustosus]